MKAATITKIGNQGSGNYVGTIKTIDGPGMDLYVSFVTSPEGKHYRLNGQKKVFTDAKKALTKWVKALNGTGGGGVIMNSWKPVEAI